MVNYDEVAGSYAKHRGAVGSVVRLLVEEGGIASGSRVLDVGCGTGNYIGALREETGCPSWGIDPSEEMLTRAKERFRGIAFELARAESLPFEGESFDLVFSVDVIHHVGDRGKYFREAHRVLKCGGRMSTATDSADLIRRRKPLSNYWPETVEEELARYPRIADLRAMMEEAGFHTITERTSAGTSLRTDIQSYRDKAYSSLHLIPDQAFERGLARLERDLTEGPIQCEGGYVLLWGMK